MSKQGTHWHNYHPRRRPHQADCLVQSLSPPPVVLPRLSFLDLPKEIRLEIYEYLFCLSPETHVIISSAHCARPRDKLNAPCACREKLSYIRSPPLPLSPSICCTNRQIYQESLPFLYKTVVFAPVFSSSCLLGRLLEQQSTFAKSCIRSIRLRAPARDMNYINQLSWIMTCFQVVDIHPTLREVQLDVSHLRRQLDQNLLQRVLAQCRHLSDVPDSCLKLIFWGSDRIEDEYDKARLVERFHGAMDAAREKKRLKRLEVQTLLEALQAVPADSESESEVTLVDDTELPPAKVWKAKEGSDFNISLNHPSINHPSKPRKRQRSFTKLFSRTRMFLCSLSCTTTAATTTQRINHNKPRPPRPPQEHVHICPCMDNAPGQCVAKLPKMGKISTSLSGQGQLRIA